MLQLDKAVALGPAHLDGPVLNPLQLQEPLVRMMVRASAELTPVVRKDGIDPRLVSLAERQYRFVGGHRQLASVEPSPGVTAVAVLHCLQIYLANPLECVGEAGADRHQFSGIVNLYLAFSKLRAEAIK